MQRLRSLSEAECYVRCYGERAESVTLLGVGPHRLKLVEREAEPRPPEPSAESAPLVGAWASLVPFPQRPD